MRRRINLVLFLIFTTLPTIPGWAASPAPQSRPRSVLLKVAGLDKRVTYSETKIPLGELVTKIAEETAVPLTAAKDVADEPVAVVVKDFPARELLEQLADLLGYQWSRRTTNDERSPTNGADARSSVVGGRSSIRFEIWQDVASKQREEALRRAVEEDVERRFQEDMQGYRALATMTQEQIRDLLRAEMPRQREVDKLPLEDRLALSRTAPEKARQRRLQMLRDMWSPIARSLALWMNRLSTEQGVALRAGWGITFASTPQPGELPLPADVLQTLRSSLPTLSGAVPEFAPSDPTRYEERRREEQDMQERWRVADGYRVTVRFAANYPRPALLVFNALTAPLSGGQTLGPGQARPTFVLNIRPEDSQPEAPPDPERAARLEQDPLLGARKPFPPSSLLRGEPPALPSLRRFRAMQDLLPDIARAYGVNVIADSYWTATRAYQLPQSTAPIALYALLDRLTDPVSTWDRRGGEPGTTDQSPVLIRIRDRNWFLDRPSEIPLRTVRRWIALCDRFGALPLDEYAALASSLTEAQIDSLHGLRATAVFPPPLEELNLVNDAREFLRLFATLLPDQQRALREGKSLPLSQLPVSARPLLTKMLSRFTLRQRALNGSEAWSQSTLSLTGQPETRTREERAGMVTFRTEPARAMAEARAASPTPTGGTSAAGAAASIRQYPVTRVKLQFRFGTEQTVGAELVVAAPAPNALRRTEGDTRP